MVKKNLLLPFILFLILYITIESLSFLGLIVLEKIKMIHYDPVISSLSVEQNELIKKILKNDFKGYLIHNTVLGWSIGKNRSGRNGMYESNSQEIRAVREYSFIPPNDKIRISAFGDSYTHGDDVKNNDTWEAQLSNINSTYEVLNFGVPGYGLDQAYLRYLKCGNKFGSDIVFIGFMSENIYRNVNVFRSFYLNAYKGFIYAKPRFIIKNNKLIFYKNPLPLLKNYEFFLNNDKAELSRLGSMDYFYKLRYKEGILDFSPSIRIAKILFYYYKKKFNRNAIEVNEVYNVNSEAFLITLKLFHAFRQKVIHNNALPVIILFPNNLDISRYKGYKTKSYQPLINYFEKNHVVYIDLLNAFEQYEHIYDLNDLMAKGSHYSQLGNKIVAEYIDNYLLENKLDKRY